METTSRKNIVIIGKPSSLASQRTYTTTPASQLQFAEAFGFRAFIEIDADFMT
jgi:hypothetical protein